MTPLAWILIGLAMMLGAAVGRLSRRGPAIELPAEDPRLAFERDRADRSEKKNAAQEGELREWAASHKVLEAQVADLRGQMSEASQAPESEPTAGTAPPEPDGSPVAGAGADVGALEATIARLEGQIAAGAGSVSQAEAIASAQQVERIAVLEAALVQAKRNIAELERRVDL